MSAGDGRPSGEGAASANERVGATGAGGDPDDDPTDGGESRYRSGSPGDDRDGPVGGVLSRLRSDREGLYRIAREVLINVAVVAFVGLLLFSVSGVWPPMVAVESGSMEPHMHKGDLVFVSEPGRFVPDYADDNGVVTYREATATDYRTFGSFGSVIVFDNPGRGGPPIIHRARFWVSEGENWYDRANPAYVAANNCEQLINCPAPHAGYITKGDANREYDQANGISGPVRPAWVTGIAQIRVPYLGWVRLALSSSGSPLVAAGAGPPPVGDLVPTGAPGIAPGATTSATGATDVPEYAVPSPSPDRAKPSPDEEPGAEPTRTPTVTPSLDCGGRAAAS